MKLVIAMCALLIFGHLLTEASTLLEYFFPDVANQKVNPWLDKSYVFYGDKEGIPLKWFIKYLTDDVLWVIVFFCLSVIGYQYSYRMFLVGCVFFVYHLFDTFMLLYNYKTFKWLHWAWIIAVIVSIIFVLLPEKKQAIVKSIRQ